MNNINLYQNKMNGGNNNISLNEIFSKNPEHINSEYIYKAKIKENALYINPLFKNNDDLKYILENLLVTIVTPNSIDAVINKVKEKNINILQSSYENGRVLESPKKININGGDYTVIAKGVGTTSYYRETGAVNPWMKFDKINMEDKEKNALQNFPFFESAGIYDKKKSLLELERSQLLQKMGIDTEIVLGIYELEEVMGPNGEYISIQKLENDNIIEKGLNPVILLRAHKSNFRILDLTMLDLYNRKESIPNLVKHILEESQKYWGTNNINEYLLKLIEKILSNRLNLITKFETINGEKWQDIIRNISIFGEELDLGTMIPNQNNHNLTNPHHFSEKFKHELSNIFTGIKTLIKSIENNTNLEINHDQIADIIYNTILSWIKSHKSELENYYKENNWIGWHENFNRFIYIFLKNCFSNFIDYIPENTYSKILQLKIEELLKLKYTKQGITINL